MECYNSRCKEECNKFKVMYCLRKISKEQKDIMAELKGVKVCEKCGHEIVVARHIRGKNKYIEIELCTNCKKMKAA